MALPTVTFLPPRVTTGIEEELAMYDALPARPAEVLVCYSLDVRPGRVIAIEASPTTEPLIRALHTAILRAVGHAGEVPEVGRDGDAKGEQSSVDRAASATPSAGAVAAVADGGVRA